MTRTRLLLTAVLAVAMISALPQAARSDSTRSGTIIAGLGGSERGIGRPGEALEGECQMAADCLAWLESGCDPALAGRQPAVTASIVDVGDLADGQTPRAFTLSGVGLKWGEVLVQFWAPNTRNMYPWFNCHEIPGSRFLTGYERHNHPRPIPAGAQWMTVTSNFDNTTVTWTLTEI